MQVGKQARVALGLLLLLGLLLFGTAGAGVVSSGVAQTQQGQQLITIAQAAADAAAKAETEVSAKVKAIADAFAEAKAKAEAEAQATAEANAKAQAALEATKKAVQEGKLQEAEASAKAWAAAHALAKADAKVRAEVQATVKASAEAFVSAEASTQAEAVAQAQASATASADAKARATAWAKATAFAAARASASTEAVVHTFTQAQTSVQVMQKLDTTITEFTEPGCQVQQCEVSTKTLSVNAIGPKPAATASVIGPIKVSVSVKVSGKPDQARDTAFNMTLATGTRLTLVAPPTATVSGKRLQFKEWQEGESTSSSNSRDVTLDRDRSLTAIYEEITPEVPELTVSPTFLGFRAQVGGPNPAGQTFRVTNTGRGMMNWSARTAASWISSINPRSGTLAAGQSRDVTVLVNIAGLSTGDYQGEIIVEAPGARKSPQRVNIKLTIEPGRCDERLSWFFGEFEGGTPSTFTAIRSFPSDVAAAVARCNIQSARQTSGQLPPGVSFTLDIPGHTRRLSGALPNTRARYVLVYDLFDNRGQRAGTLTVTIDVRPQPVPEVTLSLSAICEGCAISPVEIRGVPISVNDVRGNTPFQRQVARGSSVTVSAPDFITAGGRRLTFQRWEQDGRMVSTLTSYSFTATADTSLRAYVSGCCTLQFRARTTDGHLPELNIPIIVNGVSRITPFSVTLPFNAAITIQALTTVNAFGSTWQFDHWESDGVPLPPPFATANPLSARTDKNETITAVYAPAAPTPTVTLNIRAINTGIESGAPMNVPIRVTTPSGTTDRTTPFSVTVNQGSSVTLRILQDDFGSCGTAGRLKFDRWSGLVSSTSLQVTFTANSSGTITAEYRCK